MNNKPSLTEYLKQFSGWVTGGITFLTMLVGFVLLFRDNPQLITILIVLTTSVAIEIVFWRVIADKTEPLIAGGKGVYRYPNLRKFAIAGIFIFPFFVLVFFTSTIGRTLSKTAFLGTSTPIDIPTNNLVSVSTQITASPAPLSITDNIKSYSRQDPCFSQPYLIPPELPLEKSTIFDYMPAFNSNEPLAFQIPEDWKVIGYPEDIIGIGSISPADSTTLRVGNVASIIIDKYEPLADHINLASFVFDKFFLPGGGCGGGGKSNDFPFIYFDGLNTIMVRQQDFDYFTLQPGEFEEFVFSYGCKKSGIYHFHIEMNVSILGTEERVPVGEPLTYYCPESYSEFYFMYRSPAKKESYYEPWAVINTTYNLNYIENRQLNTSTDNDLFYPKNLYNTGGEYMISNSSWVAINPWLPCPNAPLSNLISKSTSALGGNRVKVNPSLSKSINLHSSPTIKSSIVYQLKPKTVLLLNSSELTCADNLVWWNVGLTLLDGNGEPADFVYGWVAEGDDKEKWIIPCLGENRDCNINGN